MTTATKIRVRMVRSQIGGTQRQRKNLRGLGLRKIGDARELTKSEAVLGMLRKVGHLVTVEEAS